jgi:hypothetical protein
MSVWMYSTRWPKVNGAIGIGQGAGDEDAPLGSVLAHDSVNVVSGKGRNHTGKPVKNRNNCVPLAGGIGWPCHGCPASIRPSFFPCFRVYAVTDLAAVKAALNQVKDPLLNQTLAELGWLDNVVLDGHTVLVDLAPTYAGAAQELYPLLLDALAQSGVEQLGLRERPAIPRVKPQGTVPALDQGEERHCRIVG